MAYSDSQKKEILKILNSMKIVVESPSTAVIEGTLKRFVDDLKYEIENPDEEGSKKSRTKFDATFMKLKSAHEKATKEKATKVCPTCGANLKKMEDDSGIFYRCGNDNCGQVFNPDQLEESTKEKATWAVVGKRDGVIVKGGFTTEQEARAYLFDKFRGPASNSVEVKEESEIMIAKKE